MLRINRSEERLDFDRWLRLAEEDPEAFETERKACINAYIAENSCKEIRNRLARLQWRIDQERDMATNPMDACLRIHHMMWNSFAGERGLANTLNCAAGESLMSIKHADVIQLRHSH